MRGFFFPLQEVSVLETCKQTRFEQSCYLNNVLQKRAHSSQLITGSVCWHLSTSVSSHMGYSITHYVLAGYLQVRHGG